MGNSSLAVIAALIVALALFAFFHRRRKQTPPATGALPVSSALQLRLTDVNLTETGFTDVVADLVRAAMPGSEVRVVGPLELSVASASGDVRQYLTNAWNTSRQRPETRSSVVADHVRSVVESLAHLGEALPSKSSIIPVVKDERWLAEANQLAGPNGQIAAEPLAADLWVVYAVDRPQSISYLADADRQKLGIDLPELRALALSNLRRIVPAVERHGQADAFMLTAGGNLEASLLLLDEVWDQQEPLIAGDIVAAVPSRDVVVFTGSDSHEGITALRGSIQRVLDNQVYPLSQSLIVRRNKRWVAFDVVVH